MRATLVPGASRRETITVDHSRTIDFLGEALRLYSTPAMVGDVEYACLRLIARHLDAGESSVGVAVSMEHLGATPLDQEVYVTVRVDEVDGRRVTLSAQVHDKLELVGRGTHSRFVVDVERHAERIGRKRAQY